MNVLGMKNWIYLIGTALLMSCSIYQCFIRRKSCIYALISRIPLRDIEMDYLRAKSNYLRVKCIDILGTNVL